MNNTTNVKINSTLSQLEAAFNAVFASNNIDIRVQINTYLDKTFLSALKKGATACELTHKTIGGITYTNFEADKKHEMGVGEFNYHWNKYKELQTMFPNGIYSYVEQIQQAEKELKKRKAKQIREDASLSNMLSSRLLACETDGSWEWALLDTRFDRGEKTQIEKDFLDHIAIVKDETKYKQLYWKFSDGYKIIPTDPKNSSEVCLGDDVFLEQFYIENNRTIYKCLDDVLERFAKAVATIDRGDRDAANAITFRDICPSYLQQCLCLGRWYQKVKIDKEVKKLPTDKIKLTLRKGGISATTEEIEITKGNLLPILAKKLIADVSITDVKQLRKFSNTVGEGLYCLGWLPLPSLHIDGVPTLDMHPYNAETWAKFLKDKFPSPKMSLYRLAAFVLSVRDANNYSRQCLTCVGAGNDGKSVLMSALARIIGVDKTKSGASVRDLDNTNTFGMMDFIDKRLICFDDMQRGDLYKIFNSERFKSITGAGAGAIEVNVKYARPIQWKPCGAKVMMASNFGTILSDDAMTTRCLPLAFNKNYDPNEIMCPNELVDNLAQEGVGFLQWCMDYVTYYNNRCNVNGEKPRLSVSNTIAVLSDTQYDDWYEGKEDNVWSENTHEAVRRFQKDAYEEITTIDTKDVPFIQIRNSTGDNSAYAEDNVWDDLAGILVEATDNPKDTITMQALKTVIITMGAKLKKEELDLSPEETAIVKESGICNVPPEKLKYSAAYKTLLKTIYRVFECEQTRARNGSCIEWVISNKNNSKGITIKYGKDDAWKMVNKMEKGNFEGGGMM